MARWLNVHLHVLMLDGVYVRYEASGQLAFTRRPRPRGRGGCGSHNAAQRRATMRGRQPSLIVPAPASAQEPDGPAPALAPKSLMCARLERAELNNALCAGADFREANLDFADLSHADVRLADFSGARLRQASLHRILDDDACWTGADRKNATYTDNDLARAETFVAERG